MGIFDLLKKGNWHWIIVRKNKIPDLPIFKAALDLLFSSGEYEHEEVGFFFNPESNLRAIIAIHNSVLGPPSLGGTRIRDYSSDQEALFDVLRLSRAMTFKSAMIDLPLGGAKGVILANPKQKTRELILAYGDCVNCFNGRFVTGEDVDFGMADADLLSEVTPWVAGLSPQNPRRRGGGDPSPITAQGIILGMKAALEVVYKTDNLKGKRVAIQGIAGKVGKNLAFLLKKEGAEIFGSEIEPKQKEAEKLAKKISAKIVGSEEIYSLECDIFSPNATGEVLNDQTLPQLNCKIVAGGANNPLLSEEKHGRLLHQRKILYAPDYIINAGGLINVYGELMPGGYSRKKVLKRVQKIHQNLKEVFEISQALDLPTFQVAGVLAREKLEKAKKPR